MRKGYSAKNLLLISVSVLLAIASCKKENTNVTTKTLTVTTPPVATPTTLGLYEADSSIYKLLFMAVTKVGTQTVNNALVFDTGSGGMVLDATDLLPKSMITSVGFNFTGDSTVVNGITITSVTDMVEYGDDDSTITKAYGNLAYANVTFGDENGSIVIKRVPFLLYYKGVDAQGNTLPAHYFDVLGVDAEYDLQFSNGVNLQSPFILFNPGNGLKKGFKMAALGTSNFSLEGTYAPVLTFGLTDADINSSNFVMNQLNFYPGDGYAPVFPATISYNNYNISTNILFDTGTDPYNYFEDRNAKVDIAQLPANTPVTVHLGSGFDYNFTTTPTENLTYIENPNTTGAVVSIFSIEFFLYNEYLLDYDDHEIGLKNN